MQRLDETSAPRFPAALARTVGNAIIGLLAPFCLPGRCVIAGSLRRGKEEVGDVEICFVPRIGPLRKPGEMFESQTDLAGAFLDSGLLGGKLAMRPSVDGVYTWGMLNRLAIHKATGVPVDLFCEPNPADWWRTLCIRTGPKDFNLRLIQCAKERGLNVHAYNRGITDMEGNGVAVGSEADFLEICGLGWIEPEDRG